ncbi:MAG: glucose 1-dehydrogenase [Chloroflexi bacterium]|nr:glucose 1-dehydrogenase [Chloroflexota bacterium]
MAAQPSGVLAGQVALVTGAGRGLGRSIALAFARAGADLTVTDLDAATIEDTAAEARRLGRRALALVGDVSSKADDERCVASAVGHFGQLDTLVNNAGYRTRHGFLDFPEDEMERIIAVCLKGTFLCAQAAAREMAKRRRGRIINISSVVAERGFVRTAAYTAAKGGVNALTYVLATELAPFGITVNALALGLVETPFHAETETAADWQARIRRVPLGRPAHPDEIAAMAVYLASDAASWVTGAVFRLDGGFSAAGVFPERA